MKIRIFSGSRADAGALQAVKDALARAGHQVLWCGIPTNEMMAFHAVAHEQHNSPSDLVILHGDRFEILAAAQAAFLSKVPIAHIGGGDITEGSQDDSMRHAITKLSHLHFASNEESALRIVQMGEEPWRVFNTGCPGVDSLLDTVLMKREEALRLIGLPIGARFYVVSYHPNTIENFAKELGNLAHSMAIRTNDHFVCVDPNRDKGCELIENCFSALSKNYKHIYYCPGLERRHYLSLLKHSEGLMGNSSSAFYEAPYLDVPVTIIGNRQKGRSTGKAYGDGNAAERIAEIISSVDLKTLLRKKFVTLKWEQSWPLTKYGIKFTPSENGADTQKKSSFDSSQETTTRYLTGSRPYFWTLDAGPEPTVGILSVKDSK